MEERKDVVGLQFKRCDDAPAPAEPEIVFVTRGGSRLCVKGEGPQPTRLISSLVEPELLEERHGQCVVHVELVERIAIEKALILVSDGGPKLAQVLEDIVQSATT